MDLTAENVMTLGMTCMYPGTVTGPENCPTDAIVADGITIEIIFDPARIAAHADDIGSMLDQLPEQFKPASQGGSGGWSFLNLCNDAEGNQWGEHKHMEVLCLLGIAAKKARWLFPRSVWPELEGNMPYVIVSAAGFPDITRPALG